MISSNKPAIFALIFFLFNQLGSIIDGRENSFFSKSGEVIPNDFFWCYASSKQIKNLPNHYSGIFESRNTMADFAVNNNVLINFDSHETKNDNSVYKLFARK